MALNELMSATFTNTVESARRQQLRYAQLSQASIAQAIDQTITYGSWGSGLMPRVLEQIEATINRSLNMIRQGDVLLIPISLSGKGEEEGIPGAYRDRIVLALGERTGHAHVVRTPTGMEATMVRQTNFSTRHRHLRVVKPVDLTHEEHKPAKVEPGLYEVRVQRQWDGGGSAFAHD